MIFTRRDDVRGLTTAATIWLTAAVGLAAGAGMAILATAATAIHLVVAFVYTPLVRRLPTSPYSLTSFEVSYHDGRGVLRDVLSATTDLGCVVSNLEVTRSSGRLDGHRGQTEAGGARRGAPTRRRRHGRALQRLERVGSPLRPRAGRAARRWSRTPR